MQLLKELVSLEDKRPNSIGGTIRIHRGPNMITGIPCGHYWWVSGST